MKSKSLLKWSAIIGAVVIIGISLGTIGYIYTKVTEFEQVFAQNVYIEDLSVGGLTKEEAKLKLENMKESELKQQSIVLYKNEIKKQIACNELGITYNIDETINKAFELGHKESFFEKYRISKEGLANAQKFELTKTFSDEPIHNFIKENATFFYKEPVNASIERKNRQFFVTKEVEGEALDEEATFEKMAEALKEPDNELNELIEVEAVTKTVIPEYTEASFADVQTLISSFSTSYNNASANRNENLKVAAQKISRMLLPDEIFYLSNQLEPFTEAAGYKNAGVIVNGKIEDGLGGGVCQVASTLYNAVLLTDIEIVSRQNHSLPVAYVPLGRDATYATGVIDFKFKNNTGYPLFIEGYCENNKVYVNIYGHKDAIPEYDIKFDSVVTEVIPAPATKYEDDSTLEKGKEVVEIKALDGKRVKLYKLYYKNGVLEKKELVDTSYYKPRAAVIKRGTKEVVTNHTPATPTTPQATTPPTTVPEETETNPTGNEASIPIDDIPPSVNPDDLNNFEVIQQ